MIPLLALAAAVATMVVELVVSRRHERLLRASGAHEPPGDVYPWMRIVYPACFVAMTIEGLVADRLRKSAAGTAGFWPVDGARFDPSWSAFIGEATPLVVGVGVWVAAKALKTWAIASLGDRWSFRVLVRPGTPLVTSGPYRYLRHPNYVAIIGELLGMGLVARAPLSGVASLAAFGVLLRKRVRVEERALGLRNPAR